MKTGDKWPNLDCSESDFECLVHFWEVGAKFHLSDGTITLRIEKLKNYRFRLQIMQGGCEIYCNDGKYREGYAKKVLAQIEKAGFNWAGATLAGCSGKRWGEPIGWSEAFYEEADDENLEFENAQRAEQQVYFICNPTTSRIKIGISIQPKARLRALETSCGERLELLAVIDGGREMEKDLHRRFAVSRGVGEWFDPHPDLLSYIGSLKESGVAC